MDDEDFELIRESGAVLVNNPSSNLRLRSGSFRINKVHELGIKAGIGLDGCAYDDDQDYLREIRTAWLNNTETGVNGGVDYMKVLEMATSGGANIEANKLSEGIITEGANADITLIDASKLYKPYADSYIDPLALLVQKATRDFVEMTIINGNIVWEKNSAYEKKEDEAAEKLAESIRAWRKDHPGRKDNELLISYVKEFYKDVQ